MARCDPRLSRGAIHFLATQTCPPDWHPVLQVALLSVNPSGVRMKLFDGFFAYKYFFIPDPSCQIQPYSIIRVKNFSLGCIPSKNIPVINVNDYDVLAIGQPVDKSWIKSTYESQDPQMDIIVRQQGFSARTPMKREPPQPTQSMSTVPPKRPAPAATTPSRTQTGGQSQNVVPLVYLTPYVNKWRICGIVSNKEDVREVKNPTKQLRVMSFHLTDNDNKTIKLTAWNEVADELNTVVMNDQCYYITGDAGCIRKKNARFNPTDHDFEITLTANSFVDICLDREVVAPKFQLQRWMIKDVNPGMSFVDVLAVIDKVGELEQRHSNKLGETFSKRDITLVDESCSSIALVLWREKAEYFNATEGVVVGIKHATVKEFNGGVSLSPISVTQIELNPDLQDAMRLYSWYEEQRASATIQSMTATSMNQSNIERDTRSLSVIHETAAAEKATFYFFTNAMIHDVARRDNITYLACNVCNKKVLDSDGNYTCEKCQRTVAQPNCRYNFTLAITDGTQSFYVTAFDEVAKEILGYTATEMNNFKLTNPTFYRQIVNDILFKSLTFKLRASSEVYNDQQRAKFTVASVKPVIGSVAASMLQQAINALESL